MTPAVPDPCTPVLLLPGWRDSGPGHWQTAWEAQGVGHKLVQDDWEWPRRGDWMARLDEALLALPEGSRPAVLVAHSLGCQLVAAWAAHSSHTRRVQAALLVAPPDTERADMPPQLHNWRPMVRQALPFRAIAVLSSNDPYGELTRCSALAADWGCTQLIAGPLGHLNGESGLGDWPQGRACLDSLLHPPTAHTSAAIDS